MLALVISKKLVSRSSTSRNPVSIRSYAWRYLVYGTNLLPEALRARLRRDATWRELEMALNRKLISEIQRSLEDRGVEYFFLLFDGREACDANGLYGWEEPFLHDTFEQLGIPFVSTRADRPARCRRVAGQWRFRSSLSLPVSIESPI